MPNILSYRMGYVNKPQLPLDRIARLGIKYLEVSVADDQTADEVKAALAPHGLLVSTLSGRLTPLGEETFLDSVRKNSAMAKALGARGIFVSVKAGEVPLEEAYKKLHDAGDIVAADGLFLAMETHPDLCENGMKAAETLSQVNHPAVGWNMDTANIYYYNENVDAVEQARIGAKYVRAVHAKDTPGGFKDPNFPNLGEGIVDFAGVGKVLAEVGFDGPWTMELEGIAGSADSAEKMEENVRACAEHLRALGLVE